MTNFGPGQQEVMETLGFPAITISRLSAEELARDRLQCRTYSQSVTNVAAKLEAQVPIRQHITMIAPARQPVRRLLPSCSFLQINYDAYYHE